jgi:SAM-dependent methyltransferase
VSEFRVLNLGCGSRKLDFPERGQATEIVGLDFRPFPGVDVIHDLNCIPYPFEDSRFHFVILQDVLEHLQEVPDVLAEVHRISKAGGRVHIRTPHYSSYYAYGDPTHRHFFSSLSFESFYSGEHNTYAPRAQFRLVMRRILFPRIWRMSGVSTVANRFPERWEQLFAFMFRAENMEFVLEVVK